jgi:hypothetical protein
MKGEFRGEENNKTHMCDDGCMVLKLFSPAHGSPKQKDLKYHCIVCGAIYSMPYEASARVYTRIKNLC